MNAFDPPGFLADLDANGRAAWGEWISDQINKAAAGQPQSFDFDAPRQRFFNALSTPPDADAVEKDITWTAFPKIVALDSATDQERWKTADGSRDVQDEYCEWSVTRAGGKIKSVMFTCEGPEYWEFLAATKPDVVLALYRKHIDPSVAAKELFGTDGSYLARNKWNSGTSRGAMHLIQDNNTLSAEIELAAGASNTRAPKGTLITDAKELIDCGRYGQADRHSDPKIGSDVNTLARADADITLANPVGIYFDGLSTAGWKTPDQSDPASFWKVVRGTEAKPVRAIFEVPSDRNYLVGDITVNGRPIEYGAQIADFITMKLTGLATRFGKSKHPPLAGCKRRSAKPTAAIIDVASTLGNRPTTR
ncbi:hypothetical protein [Bradyrhizobium sp. Gha]|uniref:hypothetical protein n=1 Tax=Bradyrhizobium sp. Gha TaxID=1855318 RepID=UPI0008E132B1|nr:hypothetical protein [Bradyrhizobium sp. Gha]SFI61100.1 hypothetical protein SAMN05216525_11140 [Bradyrhizobium sp. Gha]